MGVFKRQGSPHWQIEFVAGGVRHRATSGAEDKRRALAVEAKMRAAILAGDDPAKLPAITLGEAVGRYLETVIKPKGNARVLITEGHIVGRVKRDLGPSLLLTHLTTTRLSEYRDTLLSEGLASASVNRYLSAIIAILNRSAGDWGWLKAAPKVKLLKLSNARYRWLNADEEARILSHCSRPLADLVVFLVETGARLGEALRLRWGDVDLDRKPRGLVKFIKTKSGKPRGVPLSSRATALLKRILADQSGQAIHEPDRGTVFLYQGKGRAGKDIPADVYSRYRHPRRAWDSAVQSAGLTDLHLHDLRHTFASRLVMRRVPIVTVSKLLGHASLAMTMRYAHLAPDELDFAIASMD